MGTGRSKGFGFRASALYGLGFEVRVLGLKKKEALCSLRAPGAPWLYSFASLRRRGVLRDFRFVPTPALLAEVSPARP